jgi:hypothetical protein
MVKTAKRKPRGYKEGIPIPCPVCGAPMCFAEGEFNGTGKLRFMCKGKCNGAIRVVTAEYIQKCLTRGKKEITVK